MEALQTVKEYTGMDAVDILRSGVLAVVFLATVLRNPNTWLKTDAVCSGLFGLGLLIGPEYLLGFQVVLKKLCVVFAISVSLEE